MSYDIDLDCPCCHATTASYHYTWNYSKLFYEAANFVGLEDFDWKDYRGKEAKELVQPLEAVLASLKQIGNPKGHNLAGEVNEETNRYFSRGNDTENYYNPTVENLIKMLETLIEGCKNWPGHILDVS